VRKELSHYKVLSTLGRGGMGEVYLAQDSRLNRKVALKILPAEMALVPERLERFRREARAVAALNHPNIVTIYSVEEADGVHFLTMELVDGDPLVSRIKEGGLSLEEFLEIALPLAEALEAAHAKGIAHRDLKPHNVMVARDGRVKVLDFGLAKITAPSGRTAPHQETATQALPPDALTTEGVVVGTVPYMSPEQVAGQAVDHRTDIFSMGVIFYEMASGRRPFAGSSSAELVSSILRDTPPSVTELRPDLPSDLGRIVRRCLAKEPADRFQTTRDVVNELRDLQHESSTPGIRHPSAAAADEGFWVAVLPFKHRGSDPGVEALAEGLSEDIVTGLSRFSYLKVISRSSTLRYDNQTADVRAVGRELGARYVVEGSLRQAGPTLRATVQLVDASSGVHLWAETYNRSFRPEQIFELQDELAPTIVSTVADMHGVLLRTMTARVHGKRAADLSPYEALLRSFGYTERITADEHAEARAALELAIERAPDQAACWAMLSMLYAEEHKHGFNTRPDPLGRALETARRAVEAAPADHLAQHALAQAFFFRRELQDFRLAAERAIALNPMDGDTTAFMGILMAYAGDWDHGVEVAEGALRLNPHHPGWYRFASCLNAYRKGDYRAALELARKMNMPSYYLSHMALAISHARLGEAAAARKALGQLLAQRPDYGKEAREELQKWFGPGEFLESVLEGLREAGLEIPAPDE